jgi:tetratricopeptide (TPR) repeat protein
MRNISPVRAWLAVLLLSTCVPAGAADRIPVLLYSFESIAPATPSQIPGMMASLVRDELEKRGPYAVSLRNPESPLFRRVESEQSGPDPSLLHQAVRVARQMGADYLVQGSITAYEAPRAKAPGKITFRLTVASTATEVSHDVAITAEMKVPGRGPAAAAAVLEPATKAVVTAIMVEGIPALQHATPADLEHAAERARLRGREDTAAGAPDKAVSDLQRAEGLSPTDPGTYVALGEALIKQGHPASALMQFRRALALQEALGLGSLTVAAGTASATSVGTAAAATPVAAQSTTDLRLRLIRALGEHGLWDEAVAEARRGLVREPNSEPLRLALVQAAIRAGDGDTALAELKMLHRARDPKEAEWSLLTDADALVGDAPHWLDALVRGAVAGVAEEGQYIAVMRRLDQAFRSQADEAGDAERRVLLGQLPSSGFVTQAERRAARARAVSEYLGRLAYPEQGAAAHEAREKAWAGLAQASDRAARFSSGAAYEELGAARTERLRAGSLLDGVPLR